MKQQITLGLGKTKGDIWEIWYGAFFKANIDSNKNRRIWFTDLYESKKRGNVELRKVENTHHHPKYKLEKQ